jgi:hypothetical protein
LIIKLASHSTHTTASDITFKMQLTFLLFLFTAMTTLASPVFIEKRVPCTPNALETQHLGHGHDINTGDTFVGGIVKHGGVKVAGGSGCSPAWVNKGNSVGPGPLHNSKPGASNGHS